MTRCPSWCVDHDVDDHGRVVHLGEAVHVTRTGPAAAARASFVLRVTALEGARPALRLDGVEVGTEALLTELHGALAAARPPVQRQCRTS